MFPVKTLAIFYFTRAFFSKATYYTEMMLLYGEWVECNSCKAKVWDFKEIAAIISNLVQSGFHFL